MTALIVESNENLGRLWQRHVARQGIEVELASGQSDAVGWLLRKSFDVILMDLVLAEGSALAVADFASYRQPEARVIFVTNTSFFSDGSIFMHSPNACAFFQSNTAPEDLAVMVEHYGRA